MKRKYKFDKNIKKNSLSITETGEVDPGSFIPLHEELYTLTDLQEAAKKGLERFSEAIRRKNLFPTAHLASKLYEHTHEFLFDKKRQEIVVDYDDAESLPLEPHPESLIDEEDVEIDSLLKDEKEDELQEDEIEEIDAEDDTPRFKPDDDSEHEN